MKTPRSLFGREFADHLMRKWRYVESHQTGSHIILESVPPEVGVASIPAHKPLRVGTLNSLLKLAAGQRNVSRDDILKGL